MHITFIQIFPIYKMFSSVFELFFDSFIKVKFMVLKFTHSKTAIQWFFDTFLTRGFLQKLMPVAGDFLWKWILKCLWSVTFGSQKM